MLDWEALFKEVQNYEPECDYRTLEHIQLIGLLQCYVMHSLRGATSILCMTKQKSRQSIFEQAADVTVNPNPNNLMRLYDVYPQEGPIRGIIHWKITRMMIEEEILSRIAVHPVGRELFRLTRHDGSEGIKPLLLALNPKINCCVWDELPKGSWRRIKAAENQRDDQLKAIELAGVLHRWLAQNAFNIVLNRGPLPDLPREFNFPVREDPWWNLAYANFLYTSTVDLTLRLYPLVDGLLEKAPKLVWREIERLRKQRARDNARTAKTHVDNLEGLRSSIVNIRSKAVTDDPAKNKPSVEGGFNPVESPGAISSPDEILLRKEEVPLSEDHRKFVRQAKKAAIKKNPKRRKYLDLLVKGHTSREAAEKAGLDERIGRRIKDDFKKALRNQESKRKHPFRTPQTINLLKKFVRFSHSVVP